MAILKSIWERFDRSPPAAWRLFLACLAVLALFNPETIAQSRESELKAAFVYNFAQFTEWPATAYAATNAPLVIGILGDDPFGAAINDIVRGENVGGHPIEVRRLRTVSECRDCHILFVSRSEDNRVPRILRELRNRPILTVSDLPDFAHRGGMIALYTAENKLRFRINAMVAKDAGIALSSKLLRLADLVETTSYR